MYVKLPYEDLNSGVCPPYPTNTYICKVTIALRVCDGKILSPFKLINYI